MMRAVVELEFIAENYHAYKRQAKEQNSAMERYGDLLGRDRSRPWVARLTGLDEHYGFVRSFVRGQIDYSRANRSGSRSVYLYYHLRDGLYEVNERTTWNKSQRYFLRVQNAQKTEMAREEVIACLSSTSE